MARSDDILKKYGVTQVTDGSGKTASSSGNNSPGSQNSILDKYGVSQVRGGKAYDAEKIRDWFNGTYSALQSGSQYLSQDGYRKPNTSFSSVYKKYMDDADDVARFIEDNKSSMENYGDVLDMYNKSVSYLRKMNSNIQKSNEFFSQFSNEDEYNTAVRYGWYYQKYNGQTYGQLQDALSKLEDGEEKEWLTQFAPSKITGRDYAVKSAQNNTELYYAQKYLDEYAKIVLDSSLQTSEQPQGYAARNIQQEIDLLQEIKELNEKYGFRNKQEAEDKIEELKAQNWRYQKTREYGFLYQNADYGELSSVVSEDKTAGVGIGVGTRWFGQGDPVYDYINNIDGAREVHPAQKGKTPYSIYDYMDEKEIADYNYLYNTKGKEAAQGYLDYLKYALDQRRMEKLQENTAAYATEHPVISSALSVPMNLLSGAGVLDVAGQYAARKISGEYKPINYNRSGMVPTTVTTATRGTVAKNIADATGTISLDAEKHPILSRILNGKSLGDVYQLGMSMADSAAIAGLAAVGIPGGTALLGGSAASQGVLDALEAGADDTQALTMGILNGVFEMLFEEVSLEKLLKGNTKGIVRSILEQGAVEGSEEFFTTLANTVADIAVMAEKSDYRSKIAEYMSHGLNEKQATLRAIEDIAIGMGWDFAGGMMTGGIMGGASKPIQNYMYGKAVQSKYGSSAAELVQEGLASPEGTDIRTLAEKYQQKIDSGKELSGSELRRLVEANEQQIRAESLESDGFYVGQNLEKGTTEITFAEKPSKSAQASLKENGFKWSKNGNVWYGNVSQNQARQMALSVLGKTETTDVQPSETFDSIKNNSILGNNTNVESKTAQNDSQPAASNPDYETETTADETYTQKPTLESLSEKYGAYSEAMRGNYLEGQDVEEYDRAFQTAYDMGKSGLNKDALNRVEALSGISQSQREIAYEIGQTAAAAAAKAQSAKNAEAANGKTGWHKGVVRGDGVKIADLTNTFNDPQRKAYSALSTIAEATGIDIVLYQSQANEDGVFQGEQGRFKWSDNTIYIDVNAGLSGTKDVESLAKYTMLRTFGHEFTHFIEKWNPEQYNEFRKAVFDTMENPEDLIETRLAQDSTGKMSYDDASREVVAEAMTDILEDSQFIQQLASRHASVFETLRSKLKEFIDNLKSYFKSLARNGSREARLLKQEVGDSISYLEKIVKRFDEAAVHAVENYQKTVAEDNSETVSETEMVANETKDDSKPDSEAPIESKEAENDSIQDDTTKAESENESKQEAETTSYDGFSISPNTERGTLEIRFDSKPGENVRDVLKENKFRWSSKNKLWYGKADQNEISKRISEAMVSTEDSAASQEPVAENNHLLDKPAVNNTEEVTSNAETDVRGQEESDGALREDHQGGIPESEQPGEGAARLLDEPQEEALQQHDQGSAADDSGGGRPEAGRSGGGPYSERDGRSGSPGSGSVSDLRRDADVTQHDGGISETVQREIAQKSTEKPKGENYTIGESLNLAKGEKGRYRDNVSALRLIHQLNQEGRFATKEEQEVLSRYVGWGGLDNAFGEMVYNRETRKREMAPKSGWEKEFQELRQLVTDGVISEEEYRGMSESTKNAHYTSMEVILILKKRVPGTAYSGETFLDAPQKNIPGSWRTVNVNEYFSSHPEMVLGKETVTRGMYGAETLTYAPLENAGSLGDQIRSAFDKITGKMDYVQKTAESARKAAEKAVRKPKEGAYRRAQDGTITNGSGVAVTNADTAKRIGGMIDIRDAYRNLVERIQQGRTKEEIAKARKYLNQVYDSFVQENGLINDPKNKKAFEEDPYRFSLYSLETDYQKGGKGKPSTAKKSQS